MTMNGAVLPILAMYIVSAEEQVRPTACVLVYGNCARDGHETSMAETETRPRRLASPAETRPRRDVQISRRDRDETFACLET